MIRRFCFLLAAIVTASGCTATQQTPKIDFPANTRVGIINDLESYATHQNYMPVRVGNFTVTHPVDWNIPAYVEDQIRHILQEDPRYSIIALKPAAPWRARAIIHQITRPDEIKTDVAELLQQFAAENDLGAIIWIKSFKGPSPFEIAKHSIDLQGYGLFTRELLLSKKAYAYANIDVVVFKTRPIQYIGSGSPKLADAPIDDFVFGDNLKDLPVSEWNKLLPPIQKYAAEAVNKALSNANLIESQ